MSTSAGLAFAAPNGTPLAGSQLGRAERAFRDQMRQGRIDPDAQPSGSVALPGGSTATFSGASQCGLMVQAPIEPAAVRHWNRPAPPKPADRYLVNGKVTKVIALSLAIQSLNPSFSGSLSILGEEHRVVDRTRRREVPMGFTPTQWDHFVAAIKAVISTYGPTGADVRLKGSAAIGCSGGPTKDCQPNLLLDGWLGPGSSIVDYVRDELIPKGTFPNNATVARLSADLTASIAPVATKLLPSLRKALDRINDPDGKVPDQRPFDSERYLAVEADLPGLFAKSAGLRGYVARQGVANPTSWIALNITGPTKMVPDQSDLDIQVSSNGPFMRALGNIAWDKPAAAPFVVMAQASLLGLTASARMGAKTQWLAWQIFLAACELVRAASKVSVLHLPYGFLDKTLCGRDPWYLAIQALNAAVGRPVKPACFPDGGPPPYLLTDRPSSTSKGTLNPSRYMSTDWRIL